MADVVFSSSRFRLHGCTVEKKLNKTSLKDFGGIVLTYSLNQDSRVPNRPQGGKKLHSWKIAAVLGKL